MQGTMNALQYLLLQLEFVCLLPVFMYIGLLSFKVKITSMSKICCFLEARQTVSLPFYLLLTGMLIHILICTETKKSVFFLNTGQYINFLNLPISLDARVTPDVSSAFDYWTMAPANWNWDNPRSTFSASPDVCWNCCRYIGIHQ